MWTYVGSVISLLPLCPQDWPLSSGRAAERAGFPWVPHTSVLLLHQSPPDIHAISSHRPIENNILMPEQLEFVFTLADAEFSQLVFLEIEIVLIHRL